jgi:RNA polymerase sigma-70 factor, ECF subfamily
MRLARDRSCAPIVHCRVDSMAASLELGRYLQAGDLRAAGEWLVRQYAGDVVALCRAIVRERTVAEDLAQDAFSAAFTSLSGFRREASPRTWLLAITRNRCIDHLRRLSRDPWGGAELEQQEPDAHPDDAPLPAEILLRRADVDAALSSLAEAERALVVLRFRHGLEYPEIADVFGLREGTVRMRLSRALAKMRSELEAIDRAAYPEAAAEREPDSAPTPPYFPAPPAAAPARARSLPQPARSAARPAARHPAGMPPSLPAAPPPFGAAPPPPAPGAAPPPPPAPAPRFAPGAAAPPPAPRFAPAQAWFARVAPDASSEPPRASWWARLLGRLGFTRLEPAPCPGNDDEPSPELRGRLDALVRALPSG